jgi:hypothetical protein
LSDVSALRRISAALTESGGIDVLGPAFRTIQQPTQGLIFQQHSSGL